MTSLLCSNCNTYGHNYKQCKNQIVSYGIILFKINNNNKKIKENNIRNKKFDWENIRKKTKPEKLNTTKDFYNDNNIKFLLIRRKETIGFVEFMRGKYNLNELNFLIKIFSLMTKNEKDRIQFLSFNNLWNQMWSFNQWNQTIQEKKYIKEYEKSKFKFNKLKNGIIINDKLINLNYLINYNSCNWTEQEWGFPKGRKNKNENILNCANREFQEETAFQEKNYFIYKNIKPLEEIFYGSNNILYKHVYYIGRSLTNLNGELDYSNLNQKSEISNIKWLTYNEAIKVIRPYHKEKLQLLKRLYNIIKYKGLDKR